MTVKNVSALIDGDTIRARLQQLIAFIPRLQVERFVLEHGRYFDVIAPKRSYPSGMRRPKACFANCLQLAIYEHLTYVEGFATSKNSTFDIHHAWSIDASGRVYDPTWKAPGAAYFGVPFERAYVQRRFLAQLQREEGVGSLLVAGDDGYALVEGTDTTPWRVPTAHWDDEHRGLVDDAARIASRL